MATTTHPQSGTIAIVAADKPHIAQQYWQFLKARSAKSTERPMKEAK